MTSFAQHNFANQKALIRVDFNVPLDKQTLAITDVVVSQNGLWYREGEGISPFATIPENFSRERSLFPTLL